MKLTTYSYLKNTIWFRDAKELLKYIEVRLSGTIYKPYHFLKLINMYVYRFQTKVRGEGPWTFTDKHLNDKLGTLRLWLDKYEDRYLWGEDYPNYSEDFPFDDFWKTDYNSYRFGVHLPCLILYWFGPDFDLLHKYFNIYRIKVKNYKQGLSGKQVVWRIDDEVSEHVLINLKTLKVWKN